MSKYPAEIGQLIESPPIRATGNFLLIRVTDAEKTSKGGIVFAQETQTREQMGCAHGWIVSVGDFAWSDDPKPWAHLGDYVTFHRYEGVTPQVNGLDDGRFRIIADNKVLGVIQ